MTDTFVILEPGDTPKEKVKGLSFVFKRQRFVLSDGTEVTWSFGTLKDDQ